MSYAAEPYGEFAADLIANLTGGASRLRFTYADDGHAFEIPAEQQVIPSTLRVMGISGGAYASFAQGRDYGFGDGVLTWNQSAFGVPLPGAALPDLGTDFWVGFDRGPGGPAPALTDRNPGSITRTLAESVALELAVLSHQLDGIYGAAFVDTAAGRDLDQVAALVGITRRGATQAVGEVVFGRAAPAPADISILAGTLVSASSAAPVDVTVETTATVTLRRGTVTAQVPVQALVAGPAGVAGARTLTVLHRAIFGIEFVFNNEAMAFRGGTESDGDLRSRVKRALQYSGRSTRGALEGALLSVEGIGAQDFLIQEDHLAYPGVVRLTVAADIDASTALAARHALDEARPAGVRIDDNLVVPAALAPTFAADTGGGGDGPGGGANLDGVTMPLAAVLTLTPGDSDLTESQRQQLADAAAAALLASADKVGVGEPVIFNRLVADVMAVPGVLDAVIDIGPRDRGPGEDLRRFNIQPPGAGTRARLAAEDLVVSLRGERVVVDLSVTVELLDAAALGAPDQVLPGVRADVESRLALGLRVNPGVLSQDTLGGMLPPTEDYEVRSLSYRVELLDEGLRITAENTVVNLSASQQIWVRSVSVAAAPSAGGT